MGKKNDNTNKKEQQSNVSKPKGAESMPKSNKVAAQSSSSSSNTSIWMMILIITAGTGFGFYYFFEEMTLTNKLLVEQMTRASKELASVSHFREQASKLAEEIKSFATVKESIAQLQKENTKFSDTLDNLSKKINNMQLKLADNQEQVHKTSQNLESFSSTLKSLQETSNIHDAKSSVWLKQVKDEKDLREKLEQKVASFQEKIAKDLNDYTAIAETNLEGIVKDISRLSAAGDSNEKQSEKLTSEVSSMRLSVNKLEEKFKQSESLLKEELKSVETSARKAEETSSEKISIVEKTFAQQITDLSKQTVEAKQIAQSLENSNRELGQKVKSEIGDGLSKFDQRLRSLQDSSDQVSRKQNELEGEIKKLQMKSVTDKEMNDIKDEITTLTDRASKTAEAYTGVQTAIDETAKRIETKISTLTAHVRASKDDVAAMRDEVTSMSGAVSEIKTQAEQAKSSADKLEMEVKLLKQEAKQQPRDGDAKSADSP